MELRDYIRIIFKQWPLVTAVTLVIVAAAIFLTLRQPATADGAVTFTVVNSERFPANQYGYDYYFTIQAAAFLADTIDGWFASPNVTAKIFEAAHVALPADTTRAAGRIFRATKDTERSTVISASVKTKIRSETEALVTGATKVITDEVESLKKSGKIAPTFSVVTSEPVILESRPNWKINGVIALVVGLIVGSIVSVARHYFKES